MADGPVVLLGQGEQYDDPADWRELVRGRRIRRGVEVAVRRNGVTRFLLPEDVPELAPVLDALDPPGAPTPYASTPASGAELTPPDGPEAGLLASGVDGSAAPNAPAGVARGAPPPRSLPTAAPRRGLRPGILLVAAGVAVLLLLRLCGHDGFGLAPALGGRSGATPSTERRLAARGEAAACAGARGWIARAACEDPELARLRAALSRAYAARAAGLGGEARAALADEQDRWQAGRAACRGRAHPGVCLAARYRARLAALRKARPADGASSGGAPPAREEVASGDPPRAVSLAERPARLRHAQVGRPRASGQAGPGYPAGAPFSDAT